MGSAGFAWPRTESAPAAIENLSTIPRSLRCKWDYCSEPRIIISISRNTPDKENRSGTGIARHRRQNIIDCEVARSVERHAGQTRARDTSLKADRPAEERRKNGLTRAHSDCVATAQQ